MINCIHLHEYEIVTAGDVPLTLKLFVSGCRAESGEWVIEQFRVVEIVAWFDPDQGHDVELLWGHHDHVFPTVYVERFVKKFLRGPEQLAKLYAALDTEEKTGVTHAIC